MLTQNTLTSDGNALLHLKGEFDAPGTQSVRNQLEAVVELDQHEHVVLDLSHVIFIDSSGVGAIVFLFKRLKQQNRSLEIIGVQGQPRELFELLRIHKAIPTHWLVSLDNTMGVI